MVGSTTGPLFANNHELVRGNEYEPETRRLETVFALIEVNEREPESLS